MNRLWEHLDVADVIQVRVRGDDDLHVVHLIPELLKLAIDDVVALLAGLDGVAHSLGPVGLTLAVGNRHVVARVV